MKITALKRQKSGRERVNIYVDGEFRLALATEIALRAGLRADREIDDTELAALATEDSALRAREAALRLLSHRPRTEHEVRQRLMLRGFTKEVAEGCAEQLRRAGLLDDLAFAHAFVSERVRNRPSGRALLLVELRKRGVAPAEAEVAVDEGIGPGDEAELILARRALRKFPTRRSEEPVGQRRRLQAYLARRGFSPATIAQVAEDLRSE